MLVALLERALHPRDDRDLLATLLEIWRLYPDELLAKMIEDVSWRFERGHKIERQKAWKALFATQAPEAVGTLVATLDHATWAGDRDYAALAQRPPDPRVRAAILARLHRTYDSQLEVPTLPRSTPLDDAAAALLARLSRPRAEAQAEEQRHLEHIGADPADDHARAVYADWLKERGDPRGDFIAAQLAGDPCYDLSRRFGDGWLGPLGAVCTQVTYARGFAQQAILTYKPTDPTWAIGRPEWSTFTLLNVGGLPAEMLAPFLTQPPLRQLQQVHGLTHEHSLALATSGAVLPSIRKLGMILLDRGQDGTRAAGLPGVLPNLRALYAGGDVRAYAWLPAMSGLEHLDVHAADAELPEWLRMLLRPEFSRVWTRTLSVRSGGRLTIESSSLRVATVDGEVLAGALNALPRGFFQEIVIESLRWSDYQTSLVQGAAGRHGKLRYARSS